MAKKPRVTRTINPLQFDALEPHRFEDLVRRLLYGFRDWVDIEPTGKGGSDDGFDVRAWESDTSVVTNEDDGQEGSLAPPGRLWQVQGKREKSLSPAQIKKILDVDIDVVNPPYGYILAAATNISKKGYDLFRQETKKKGVREAYFWGKDHLEDQLSLPQNDEILFTFFGISLSPRRRSRVAEVKFGLNNKNKILRLIFGKDDQIDHGFGGHHPFCIRDINASSYPYKQDAADGSAQIRWGEYAAIEVGASGVIFKKREYYAWVHEEAKTWDYSAYVDLTGRRKNIDEVNERRLADDGRYAEHYWRHLPRRQQAKLMVYGFVAFDDMLIVDDKGDPQHACPHIFVEFDERSGLFSNTFANVVHNHRTRDADDFATEHKKIVRFPKTFARPAEGRVHPVESLPLPEGEHWEWLRDLYSFDGAFKHVAENDIIEGTKKERDYEDKKQMQVTHMHELNVGDFLKQYGPGFNKEILEKWAKRAVVDDDKVMVYELHPIFTGYQGAIHFKSE